MLWRSRLAFRESFKSFRVTSQEAVEKPCLKERERFGGGEGGIFLEKDLAEEKPQISDEGTDYF